jgi:hypothetical protein
VLLRGSLLLTEAVKADRVSLLFLLFHAKGANRGDFFAERLAIEDSLKLAAGAIDVRSQVPEC